VKTNIQVHIADRKHCFHFYVKKDLPAALRFQPGLRMPLVIDEQHKSIEFLGVQRRYILIL